MITEEKLKRLAYDLYKIDWINSHIDTERQLGMYREYALSILFDEDFIDNNELSFEEFLDTYGYDGELYVCYDEFIENEYRDSKYMIHLLSNQSIFWKAYCKLYNIKEN